MPVKTSPRGSCTTIRSSHALYHHVNDDCVYLAVGTDISVFEGGESLPYRAARDGRLNDKAQDKLGISGKATPSQAKAYAAALVKDAHYVYGKDNFP